MHKRKQSDTFSFTSQKAPVRQILKIKDRKQLMANYQYRIDALDRKTSNNQIVNNKVLDIDRIIQQNAKRKQQIQQDLKLRRQDFVQPDYLKSLIQKNVIHIQAKQFSKVQSNKSYNKRPLSVKQSKVKPYQPSKIELNQLQLAIIEKQLSFPQYPTISKQKQMKLKIRLQTLNKVHEHSDILYLLIICLYHLDLFYDVLNRIRQLILFKKFNPKGLWVAAEAAYNLQIFQECRKLSQLSISHIKENAKILPRLLYLKAKSNLQLHNHLEAIITYNQLITIQPLVPQYYLERSLLFERTNNNDYAQKDFQKYRQLKPNWKNNILQKILGEKLIDHKNYYQSLMRSLQDC